MSFTFTAQATPQDVFLRCFTDDPAADTVSVTRSIGGTTSRVRAPAGISGGIWAARDIEVLYGTPITYLAQIRDTGGTVVATATATAAVAHAQALLRDVLMPVVKVPVRLVGPDAQDHESDVRGELLRPLGRAAAVLISDARSAPTGTLQTITLTDAEAAAMNRVLGPGRTLLLTGPAGWEPEWPRYVAAGKVARTRPAGPASPLVVWAVEWHQVDPPDPGLFDPVAPRTWGDLRDAGTRWADIAQTPWIDVLYPAEAALLRVGG